MDILPYLFYIMVGILAGLLAGLLGISGGVITVPCLTLIFHWIGFPQAHILHAAIGTSLAAMVLTGISAAWSHHLKSAVVWDVVKAMLPGILVGSVVGASIARILPGVILALVFGLFSIGLGIYFYCKRFRARDGVKKPKTARFLWIGFGISGIANILGIGGGIVTVPVLVAHHYPEKKAIGTSAATGLIISFLGALGYLYFGLGEIQVHDSIGYLYLPAFILVGIASALSAPFGAKLAHQLPAEKIRKIFGIFLVVSGLLMIFT